MDIEKMSQKIVDIEGDIPMDVLMELQKKLKKNNGPEEQTSFINSKETKKIQQTNHSNQVKPTQAQSQPHKTFDPFPKASPPQKNQESMDMNAFWTVNNKASQQSGNEKFDSFANFFPTSNNSTSQPQKQPKNEGSEMYDFFFPTGQQP